MPAAAGIGWPALAPLIALNAVAGAPLVPSIDYMTLAAVRRDAASTTPASGWRAPSAFLLANLAGGPMLGRSATGSRCRSAHRPRPGRRRRGLLAAASSRRAAAVAAQAGRPRLPAALARHRRRGADPGEPRRRSTPSAASTGARTASRPPGSARSGPSASPPRSCFRRHRPAARRLAQPLPPARSRRRRPRSCARSAWPFSATTSAVLVLQMLHGLTFGATQLGAMAAVSRFAPEGARGRAQGTLSAANALASASATLMSGPPTGRRRPPRLRADGAARRLAGPVPRGPRRAACPRRSLHNTTFVGQQAQRGAGYAARRASGLEFGAVRSEPSRTPTRRRRRPAGGRIGLSGRWTADQAPAVEAAAARIAGRPAGRALPVDLAGLERLDTLGAWVLERTRAEIEAAGGRLAYAGAPPEHRILLGEVRAARRPSRRAPPPRGRSSASSTTSACASSAAGRDLVAGLAFLGEVVAACIRVAARPGTFRGHGPRQPDRAGRLPRRADHRADLVPRRRHRRPAGHLPAPALRRPELRRQPDRHPDPARARRAAHLDHGGGPLRLGLHRRDRLDADARGGRRPAGHGPRSRSRS